MNLEIGISCSYICSVNKIRKQFMKIKQDILDLVDNPQSRTKIALDLKIGEQSVALQMRNNSDNGRMTKMDFLMAISKEAGVPVEEILEETEVKAD